MDDVFNALYIELGSRAFADLAGENSSPTLSRSIIMKRGYKAGVACSPELGRKRALKGVENANKATKRGVGYAKGTLLAALINEEVKSVQFLRYSKKGNLVCHVMGTNLPNVTLSRKDILCRESVLD